MIITNDFVMINLPKTGSTFVRNCLQKIYEEKKKKRPWLFNTIVKVFNFSRKSFDFRVHLVPEITTQRTIRYQELTEHGKVFQIPKNDRNKQVVTVIRDVYERYVSAYEFRDWEKAPWLSAEELTNLFPNYPNITFEEFVKLMIHHNPFLQDDLTKHLSGFGPLTIQFIIFYHSDPFQFLENKDIEVDRMLLEFEKDVQSIRFLQNCNLNRELYDFLLEFGYSELDINWILTEKKINQSKPQTKPYSDYFTPEIRNEINEYEKFLLNFMIRNKS